MSEWRKATIGDFITLQRGFDITRPQQQVGEFPVVSSGGISSYHNVAMAKAPGVVIGRKGTLGKVFYLDKDYWPHDTTLWVKDFKGNLPRFVYYYLKTMNLLRYDVGSSNPTLNRNHVHPVSALWPHFREQEAIAGLLEALDDKIETNECIVRASSSIARLDFRRVTSSESAVCRVGEIAEFHNRRRVPLSGKQRELFGGQYPYYGAAGQLDSVADYIFDGPHVLVGEDGSVVTDDGGPVIQYVWGRFWVSNHAHVLTGRSIPTELLAVALEAADVRPSLTGAVQPKLSMGNLKAVPVTVPIGNALSQIGVRVAELAALRRAKTDENQALATLRDALLPKLISGSLRIKDAERQVEDVV